jgi:hypothetical protein
VVILRKRDAAVDDQQRLLRLQREAVHADLAESSQRYDA